MAKSRPDNRNKKRKKGKANGTAELTPEMAVLLLEQSSALLQMGEPEQALPLAQKAMKCLSLSVTGPNARLPALEVLGEIHIELGNPDEAGRIFKEAAEIDPDGTLDGVAGGGADKFLWLAQLCDSGGEESVMWFEKGAAVLRRQIDECAQQGLVDEENIKRHKLANALCGAAEVYMTDLSWDEDAESKCEALVTEACVVADDSPEPLQTLASVRISQLRFEDARSALKRSLEMWSGLPPDDPSVPDYPTRISLARLLMETTLEETALEILERLVAEDDTSVEAWYLGGWCLHLLAEKQPAEQKAKTDEAEGTMTEKVQLLNSSRDWLHRCLKLYMTLEYEDERLKEHADELLQDLDKVLGPIAEGEADLEDEWDPDWEDEDEAGDGDDVMEGA